MRSSTLTRLGNNSQAPRHGAEVSGNPEDLLHFPKQTMKFFISVATSNLRTQPRRKPNIVLIYRPTTWASRDIGCFGSTKNRTPVLDQMAKEGRRFH